MSYVSPFRDDLGRVMPSVFVAGPAKSGSTFLWECIHQTFHPQRVCGSAASSGWSDASCGGRRFVLPAVAADTAHPACLRFQKESAFWRWWGRRPQYTWARYGGPRLPVAEWELKASSCVARRRELRWSRGDDGGPPQFAGHRAMEDVCLQDTPCGGGGSGSRVPYATPLPARCMSDCAPCKRHPGWVNNVEEPCAISPYKCASTACATAPYVPKVLRRANYSGHHARAFSFTAFPSVSGLRDVAIDARRLSSLEGNPGIFQTPPRHARAIASLSTPAGQQQLQFIVGLRDPFDLAFSLWGFLSTIGQEGRRVEQRMSRALAAIQACNDTLADEPMRLLTLPPPELAAYRACLDDRPRSKQHFYLYGGLYALHLLGWLHLGYKGERFLFVRMTSLPRTEQQVAPLQRELATFLGMSPPRSTAGRADGACLSATMITSKRQRIRAHNASVREVKAAFRSSPTAASLQRFFGKHQALLQALLERERVRVY